MPWDKSLNTDVKQPHNYRCILSDKLVNKDTRKFSVKTPKLISRIINHLLEDEWVEGFLASEGFIQYCDLALDDMYTVYQAGGAIVP